MSWLCGAMGGYCMIKMNGWVRCTVRGCIFVRHLVALLHQSAVIFFVLRSSGLPVAYPQPQKKIEPGFSSLLHDARYSKGASVCGICMHTATIKDDNTLFLWLLLLCVGWCWGRIRSVAQARNVRMICVMISPVPGYATPRGTYFLTCPARQEIGRS